MEIFLTIMGASFLVGAKRGFDKWQQEQQALNKKVEPTILKTKTMWN